MHGRRHNETRERKVALHRKGSLLDEAHRISDEYFRERAARGNVGKAKRIVKRAGRGNPPVSGDESD
jgi:hypothetical protein